MASKLGKVVWGSRFCP